MLLSIFAAFGAGLLLEVVAQPFAFGFHQHPVSTLPLGSNLLRLVRLGTPVTFGIVKCPGAETASLTATAEVLLSVRVDLRAEALAATASLHPLRAERTFIAGQFGALHPVLGRALHHSALRPAGRILLSIGPVLGSAPPRTAIGSLLGEGLRAETLSASLSATGKGPRAIRALTALACHGLAATGALLLPLAGLRTLHPALAAERTLPLTLAATAEIFLSKGTSLCAESLAATLSATGKGLRAIALTSAGHLALLALFLHETLHKFPNPLALFGGEVL